MILNSYENSLGLILQRGKNDNSIINSSQSDPRKMPMVLRRSAQRSAGMPDYLLPAV